MPTLLNQQGHQLSQFSLRKSGAGMITRVSVGYDDGRTVRLILRCPHYPLPPSPGPTTKNKPSSGLNGMAQPASQTIHTSQRHQSVISSLPSQSHTQRSPSRSRRTSHAVLRSLLLLPRRRILKRATRGSSASPCAACARCSGAPAPARRRSCAALRRSSCAG